jgi:hypothetical protein
MGYLWKMILRATDVMWLSIAIEDMEVWKLQDKSKQATTASGEHKQ